MRIIFIVLFIITFVCFLLDLLLPDFIRDQNNDLHEVNVKLKKCLTTIVIISIYNLGFALVLSLVL